jgi:hypothetical protein
MITNFLPRQGKKKKKLRQLKTNEAPGPVFMKIIVNADIVKTIERLL